MMGFIAGMRWHVLCAGMSDVGRVDRGVFFIPFLPGLRPPTPTCSQQHFCTQSTLWVNSAPACPVIIILFMIWMPVILSTFWIGFNILNGHPARSDCRQPFGSNLILFDGMNPFQLEAGSRSTIFFFFVLPLPAASLAGILPLNPRWPPSSRWVCPVHLFTIRLQNGFGRTIGAEQKVHYSTFLCFLLLFGAHPQLPGRHEFRACGELRARIGPLRSLRW